MEKLALLYFILIILSDSLVLNYEADPSSYSLLMPKVRKDVINQILKSLPNRRYVNILQMSNTMAKNKEDYSLNEAETAYLVYAWLGQNIAVDCNLENTGYEFPNTVYKDGKGNYAGFAALFFTMASNLNIEVVPIKGKQKIPAGDNYSVPYKVVEIAWDSILIDGTYYLVDSAIGAGYCIDGFVKSNTDFYFGTKPELFIRSHFPDEENWQLLEKKITLSKFNSWPYITHRFYLQGFETLSPDTIDVDVSSGSKITLTYDKKNTNLHILVKFLTNNSYTQYNGGNVSNGKVEIVFDGKFKNANYLLIYANQEGNSAKYYTIMIYKIN